MNDASLTPENAPLMNTETALTEAQTPNTAPATETATETEPPSEVPTASTPPRDKRPEKTDKAKKNGGKRRSSEQHSARSVGFIALPVEVSQMVKKYGVTHPGLVLNKYAVLLRLKDKRLQYDFSTEQKKRILQKVAHLLASTEHLKQDWEREKNQRQEILNQSGARQLSQMIDSPLVFSLYHPFATLGIELHPIFGFPQISANHVKGALRQYVESYWLPKQEDATAAQQKIQAAFGSAEDEGELIFHDAWPDTWPALAVEQLANHHRPYYLRREMPGDWQEAESDCFLVIKPGSRFHFPLSARRPAGAETLLDMAETWLKAMLAEQGLGAYRQQGYGLWQQEHHTAENSLWPQHWQTQMSLNSPAFLAGATQRPEDCRVRPSMLRGLLRWWWRTLHSGFLNHRELLALESALWGSEHQKGAIRLHMSAEKGLQARRYRPEELLQVLPGAEGKRRSPGLVYLGYGFFGENTKRYFIAPEASWELSLEARDTVFRQRDLEVSLPAEMVLQQAQAALWLLCHYGGLGQRKRKGFGSLQDLEELNWSEDHCLELGVQLRQHCQLLHPYADERAESPSLMQRIELPEIATPWKNAWFVLHQLGESLQSFMQNHKHEAQKKALGLPRIMADPVNSEFTPVTPVGDRHAAPYFLHLQRSSDGNYGLRIVGFPASRLPNTADSQKILTELVQHLRADLAERIGKWPEEPNLDLSQLPRDRDPARKGRPPRRAPGDENRPERPYRARSEVPADAHEGRERRPRRERRHGDEGRPQRCFGDEARGERKPRREEHKFERRDGERSERRGKERDPRERQKSGLPRAGDWLEAVLLEEKTKKGGWRAQDPQTKLAGPLVNTGLVPGDQTAGEKVELIVHASNKLEMIFRWPTEAEREKHQQRANRASKR